MTTEKPQNVTNETDEQTSGLSPQQEQALMLVFTGKAARVAAETVGVHLRQVQRWQELPAWKREFEQKRAALQAEHEGQIREAANIGIARLVDLAQGVSANSLPVPPSVQRAAANDLVTMAGLKEERVKVHHTGSLSDLTDEQLEARLAARRATLDEDPGGRP